MTQREFFNAVINAAISDEMTAHAVTEIVKLDKRNATPSKADKERAEQNGLIKAKILGVLTASDVPMIAADIGTACEVSTAKASSLLRQMIADGVVTKSEIKIKGKGKTSAYAVAAE